MRFAASLIVVLALAACGDVGTAERLSSKETLDGIDVPTIGTVGDFPDPAHRHVLNVARDGRLVLDAKDVAFDALKPALDAISALSSTWFSELGEPIPQRESEKSYRVSGENLLLRIDGDLPWAAVQQILLTAGDARLLRGWFVVRHEDDRREGALELPIFLEGGQFDMGGSVRVGRDTYGFDLAVESGAASPELLYDALGALHPKTRDFDVHLRVPDAMPLRAAVQFFDAALRSKRPLAVGFWGREDGKGSAFAQAVKERAPNGATYSLYVLGARPFGAVDRGPMPKTPRVHGVARTYRPWMYPPSWDGDARRLVELPK